MDVQQMVVHPEGGDKFGYVPTARAAKPARPPKTPPATPPTAKKEDGRA